MEYAEYYRLGSMYNTVSTFDALEVYPHVSVRLSKKSLVQKESEVELTGMDGSFVSRLQPPVRLSPPRLPI